LQGVCFSSPKQLNKCLGLFQCLGVECCLNGTNFDDSKWDVTPSCIFSPSPTLKFLINTSFGCVEPVLKLIHHHQWNITVLTLSGLGEGEYEMTTPLLEHIGTSLKMLNIERWFSSLSGRLQ